MQALGQFSENKIILLHLQASGLNISNVGFELVFTTEFKFQAFHSKIESLKKKQILDYKFFFLFWVSILQSHNLKTIS